MKWTREENGRYAAGPYTVTRLIGSTWRASGPGMDPEVNWHGKDLAQDECERAALRRIAGREYDVEPVVGDLAVVTKQPGRKDPRGRVTSIIQNSSPGQRAIFTIRFNVGGGRTCRYREEFQVVVP